MNSVYDGGTAKGCGCLIALLAAGVCLIAGFANWYRSYPWTPCCIETGDGVIRGMKDPWGPAIRGIEFDFEAHADGDYIIEGWQNPHRSPNILANEFHQRAKKGDRKTLKFDNGVYRIDVICVSEGADRKSYFIYGNAGTN